MLLSGCYASLWCYRKEFNIEVLKKFIALQDFKGKILVDALRYIYMYTSSAIVFTL